MNKMSSKLIGICLTGLLAVTGCAIEPAQEMTDEMIASMSDEDVAETSSALSCSQAQWQDPMRAALAVSMAREIGRIDALKDLYSGDRVYLTQDAKNRCASRGFGACNNTQAILDHQLGTVNNYVPQNIFSATAFREDLKASFARQQNHEANLRRNSPRQMPGEYALNQIGTFSVAGACGVHFEFAAQGVALQNLQERLMFFGGNQNPYIAFIASAGKIAIDPSGTMNGDSGTSSGSVIATCTATNLNLKDKSCSCNAKTGKLRPAPWNISTLYCAT